MPSDKNSVSTDQLSQNQDARSWWKEQIIYQIYPRSFKDTSGNGVGDLRGIIEKLDYIKRLGVTCVWINPIYASPNDDNGYDISDYRAIMPEFGTMEDFDELLAGLHKRDIRFVMDLVVNHSSDEHEWFEQSRSSRDNPYRDYYHWWPAEKGEPPFRWSYFDEKGDAWQYDKQTDAYYLHYFTTKQPDLNWENPKVRQEVFDIMKFWANKGVDGFRLDAFQFVSKDIPYPDYGEEHRSDIKHIIKYQGMGPNIHEYLREMYDEVLSQYDVFAVSEGVGSSFEDAHNLVDEDRKELQMAYHFECVDMGKDVDNLYKLKDFKALHTRWDASFAQKGWISIFLANHDLPRMVSKFGDDREAFRAQSAKMLNTFLLTMRGTPYCYFGDELGMSNINFTHIEHYQDVAARNAYKKAQSNGEDMQKFMQNLTAFSRDNSRTPMQWSNSKNAGFTHAESAPWLTINDNYVSVNVKEQEKDSASVLNHFKALTQLRRKNLALVYGDYELLLPEHETLYVYTRCLEQEKFLVVLSFSDKPESFELPAEFAGATVAVNNAYAYALEGSLLKLEPYQSIVFQW